jgi:ketosteroid isomerase-like protein
MAAEQNKAVARELFARFSAGDIPGVLALMTEDCTWLIPGKPERMRTAGLYDKERIAPCASTSIRSTPTTSGWPLKKSAAGSG